MRILTDQYGDLNFFWSALLLLLGIAALFGLIMLTVRQVNYHYSSTYCQQKLHQVDREGKFVQYNFWEYDCLAKTTNGTYIPLENLYNNVQENSVENK